MTTTIPFPNLSELAEGDIVTLFDAKSRTFQHATVRRASRLGREIVIETNKGGVISVPEDHADRKYFTFPDGSIVTTYTFPDGSVVTSCTMPGQDAPSLGTLRPGDCVSVRYPGSDKGPVLRKILHAGKCGQAVRLIWESGNLTERAFVPESKASAVSYTCPDGRDISVVPAPSKESVPLGSLKAGDRVLMVPPDPDGEPVSRKITRIVKSAGDMLLEFESGGRTIIPKKEFPESSHTMPDGTAVVTLPPSDSPEERTISSTRAGDRLYILRTEDSEIIGGTVESWWVSTDNGTRVLKMRMDTTGDVRTFIFNTQVNIGSHTSEVFGDVWSVSPEGCASAMEKELLSKIKTKKKHICIARAEMAALKRQLSELKRNIVKIKRR